MPKPFISQLLYEHIRMRRVLRIVERQLDLAESCATPDLKLLQNALGYLRGVPARLHHSHEDLMFDKLQAADPGLTDDLAFLRRQHAELYEWEDWLLQLVVQAKSLGHAVVPRLLFVGRNYLRVQKNHASFEEQVIFPRAARILTAADSAALERPASAGGGFDDHELQQRVLTLYRELIPVTKAA